MRPVPATLRPWYDPRSYHSILDARLGGASSARSDEQPGAGVHLKRVQRERGPVELWRPAPTHPARRALHSRHRGTRDMPRPAFYSCPAAVELDSVAARRTPDPSHTWGLAQILPHTAISVSAPGRPTRSLTLSTQARLGRSPRAGAEPPIRVSISRSHGDRTPAPGFRSLPPL